MLLYRYSTVNDLWRFDIKGATWNRLENLYTPAARALMGESSADTPRSVQVMGITSTSFPVPNWKGHARRKPYPTVHRLSCKSP